MLTQIIHAFSKPKPAPLPEPDARLALGALMVRVAKSDHDYQLAEIRRIDRLLARLNAIGPIEAAKMRALCEKLEKQAPATEKFAHLIRETVSFEARIDALEALWEVALADGVGHAPEIAVVDATREAMGLSESDSMAARKLAENNA